MPIIAPKKITIHNKGLEVLFCAAFNSAFKVGLGLILFSIVLNLIGYNLVINAICTIGK